MKLIKCAVLYLSISGCVVAPSVNQVESQSARPPKSSEAPLISVNIKRPTAEESGAKNPLGAGSRYDPAEYTFSIHHNEDLRSAISRFAATYNLKRVVIDLDAHATDPGRVVSNKAASITTKDLSGMGVALVEELNIPYVGVGFHKAIDGKSKSLVFTNRGYTAGSELHIHDVRAESLLKNSARIAEFYNWTIAKNAWQLPVDYQVKYPYPLVSKDLISAMSRLFERYPAQAQLMQSTNQVMFASRQHPVNL